MEVDDPEFKERLRQFCRGSSGVKDFMNLLVTTQNVYLENFNKKMAASAAQSKGDLLNYHQNNNKK